jgi:hypothetical protein
MSSKNKKNKNNKNHQQNQNRPNNERKFTIPEDVKQLLKLNWKKFKKNGKDYFDSKKEMKKAFYDETIDYLPEAIQLLVRYGHMDQVQEVKGEIYTKISDPDFVTYLIKGVKNENIDFQNMDLLPNVIYEMIVAKHQYVQQLKKDDPNVQVDYNMDDLVALSHTILKKKIKKFEKAGLDKNFAFDVLSIIPTPDILAKSAAFHIKELFMYLYEYAKTKEVPFKKVMECMFKDSEKIDTVITFALLERKEKISGFNDSQKKLFNDITEFCVKTMEEMKKDQIKAILKAYIDNRKRDETQKKDTNRRYYLSSLPENDYPKINKVMEQMVEADESLKKYF